MSAIGARSRSYRAQHEGVWARHIGCTVTVVTSQIGCTTTVVTSQIGCTTTVDKTSQRYWNTWDFLENSEIKQSNLITLKIDVLLLKFKYKWPKTQNCLSRKQESGIRQKICLRQEIFFECRIAHIGKLGKIYLEKTQEPEKLKLCKKMPKNVKITWNLDKNQPENLIFIEFLLN